MSGAPALGGVVKAYIATNPRFAPYRKVLGNVAALVVSLALFLVSIPTDMLPPSVTGGIAIAVGIVTLLTYFIPNEVTPQQADQLETYADKYGRHAAPDAK